jgi:hypothetical protein
MKDNLKVSNLEQLVKQEKERKQTKKAVTVYLHRQSADKQFRELMQDSFEERAPPINQNVPVASVKVTCRIVCVLCVRLGRSNESHVHHAMVTGGIYITRTNGPKGLQLVNMCFRSNSLDDKGHLGSGRS